MPGPNQGRQSKLQPISWFATLHCRKEIEYGIKYFHISNKEAGWNKRVWWADFLLITQKKLKLNKNSKLHIYSYFLVVSNCLEISSRSRRNKLLQRSGNLSIFGSKDQGTYRKVYKLKNQLFVKTSHSIRIENPLHKRSEKACMCFNTRRASTRDYMV